MRVLARGRLGGVVSSLQATSILERRVGKAEGKDERSRNKNTGLAYMLLRVCSANRGSRRNILRSFIFSLFESPIGTLALDLEAAEE